MATAQDHPALTDEAAFELYVLPEVDVLLRVALSMTRNAADAEDLVQDTMLRAFRGISRFDGRYPRAWLLTILRNAHVNRNRRRRPELLRDADAGTSTSILETQTPYDSAEEIAVGQSFDHVVEDALARLPDRYRRVVELVDIEGLSYRGAAESLGVPVGTVMSRLHRARRRIRDQLVASGIVSGGGRR
jgi:RNA polymerase sigma-70 factor (ECF subfamily)